jgi:hypothetical protein
MTSYCLFVNLYVAKYVACPLFSLLDEQSVWMESGLRITKPVQNQALVLPQKGPTENGQRKSVMKLENMQQYTVQRFLLSLQRTGGLVSSAIAISATKALLHEIPNMILVISI